MQEIEGIVIRATPFREHDQMVTILSNDKLIGFLARGTMKNESKNASSVQLYTKARYVLLNGKEGLFLKNAQILETYPHARNTLSCLTALGFLGEINTRLLVEEDTRLVYPYFSKALTLLNDGFDTLTVILTYFAQVLKLIGYGMDVDECQICHNKGPIAAINYELGGFICPNCFSGEKLPENNVTKLKIIRYIFKVDLERFGSAELPKEESVEVLKELIQFVSDHTGVDLKSYSLIEKVFKV